MQNGSTADQASDQRQINDVMMRPEEFATKVFLVKLPNIGNTRLQHYQQSLKDRQYLEIDNEGLATHQNDIEIGQLEVDEDTGQVTMKLHADANSTGQMKSSKNHQLHPSNTKQDIMMNISIEQALAQNNTTDPYSNSTKLVEDNSMGIISQNLKTTSTHSSKQQDSKSAMTLKALVNYKLKCTPAAGNYRIDRNQRDLMFMENKQGVTQVPTKNSKHIEIRDSQDYCDDESDAGSAFLEDKFHFQPIICNIGEKLMTKQDILREEKRQKKQLKNAKNTLEYYDQTSKQKQQKASQQSGSNKRNQKESDSLLSETPSALNYQKMGVYKEKRVSLPTDQLIKKLLYLYQHKKEYKLNELVDVLNHPVQPLKTVLKDLCEYHQKEKVFRLKDGFRQ